MATSTQYGINLYSLTLTGLDMTVTGATKIGTTDANNRFMPLFGCIILTSISGFTSVPRISVGTNSPNYDNGIGNTTLISLNQANAFLRTDFPNLNKTVPAGTDVYVNVVTATVATTYISTITILGFYY